ncbi:FxsA family protein [Amycolatopsis ruanii]|uniref:FxsA family protein n=1 Tax=Amycolatopsis ruanii TaxID=944491 RepID=UPI000E227647|nr:FxsA family protein [Amycolatopsis ruanii]
MAVVLLLYIVAEVAAVWAVSSLIGFLGTLGLLVVGAFLGSWLARREGARAAQAFLATARAGRSPHAEITDGMLVAFGGLLIMIPGFLSDLAGLALPPPPTRGVVRRAWLKRAERRMPNRLIVVDGEVVDKETTNRPIIEG